MHPLILAPTTLMDATQLEVIEAAANAGYDGVGLRLHPSPGLPYHPVVGDRALIADMRRVLADNRLSVLDIYSFYLQPGTELDAFMPALALGAEFGARYALVQGADSDGARLRDNFAGFCERARPLGITAALEFVPNRELATLDAALALIRDAGQANAALCVDPLHLVRAGGTPADLARVEPSLLPYVQYSDGILSPGEPDLALAKKLGVGIRRLPGEGMLPLSAFLAALPADIPLSVEISTPQAAAMPANAWASLVRERTLAALAHAGRGG